MVFKAQEAAKSEKLGSDYHCDGTEGPWESLMNDEKPMTSWQLFKLKIKLKWRSK